MSKKAHFTGQKKKHVLTQPAQPKNNRNNKQTTIASLSEAQRNICIKTKKKRVKKPVLHAQKKKACSNSTSPAQK
jgi:hypothetical protein